MNIRVCFYSDHLLPFLPFHSRLRRRWQQQRQQQLLFFFFIRNAMKRKKHEEEVEESEEEQKNCMKRNGKWYWQRRFGVIGRVCLHSLLMFECYAKKNAKLILFVTVVRSFSLFIVWSCVRAHTVSLLRESIQFRFRYNERKCNCEERKKNAHRPTDVCDWHYFQVRFHATLFVLFCSCRLFALAFRICSKIIHTTTVQSNDNSIGSMNFHISIFFFSLSVSYWQQSKEFNVYQTNHWINRKKMHIHKNAWGNEWFEWVVNSKCRQQIWMKCEKFMEMSLPFANQIFFFFTFLTKKSSFCYRFQYE